MAANRFPTKHSQVESMAAKKGAKKVPAKGGTKREVPRAEQVKRLGEDLLASAENVNNVGPLLKALAPAEDDEVVFCQAAAGLQAFFLQQVSSGDLDLSRAASAAGASSSTAVAEPDAVYRTWLRGQYRTFTRRLLGRLRVPRPQAKAQTAALRTLMELVRGEQPLRFANELFSDVVLALVSSRSFGAALLAPLADLFDLADVRYFALVACRLAAEGGKGRLELGGDGSGDEEEEGEEEGEGPLPKSELARNVYDVLVRIPPSVEGLGGEGGVEVVGGGGAGGEGELKSWCGAVEGGAAAAAVATGEGAKQRRKRKRLEAEAAGDGAKAPAATKVRWANAKQQKKMFSEAWIAVLRMEIPEDIYKKALARLHKDVIPHMASPLLLSDLLTDSYDRGGLIGMLALNGLFVLVQQYGLEYPQFYRKLYNLLEASAFRARYRKRFFELAGVFLSSSHLPAYLAAAFAKRMARLALRAPPGGAMLAVAFCHNLLRRHPGCNVLLNRRKPVEAKDGGAPPAPGVDPFDEAEEDPAKCRAIESSLWEMEALRTHYCPQVARFVEVLDKDLADRTKTSELNIAPLTEASYASVFDEEMSRKLKRCPLAFYKRGLAGLFDAGALGGGGEKSGGEGGVPGWPGWTLPVVEAPEEEEEAKAGDDDDDDEESDSEEDEDEDEE